jgi:DNA-binding SARP family transcriptional activator
MPETERLHVLLREDASINDDVQAQVFASQTLLQIQSHSTVQLVSYSSSPTIRIQALGEPTVYVENIRVKRWRMAHAMELFFFLLEKGRPVHKEQIISALWPDADGQVEQTLRSTIYYLRKLFGAACITSSNSSYMLDLAGIYGEESIWYDVAVFLKCYATAQAALAAGDEGVAYTTFEEMTRLYHGDYVQSFYCDWCTQRRYTLRHAYMDALYQLALIAYRQHHLDESIAHWQHLLTMDSCLEEAHYWLICCYMQQGKRGMALRQYQNCVLRLREELSIEPGDALQHLYQRLTREN